ncbi:hypothetical protein CGLO_12797 [Colletotrichum gloeosporioides Cg-14]|jgi:hypothetical protein
MIAA